MIALRDSTLGPARALIGVALLLSGAVRGVAGDGRVHRGVFARASAAYFEAIAEPDTRAAIKLTLITAAIVRAART